MEESNTCSPWFHAGEASWCDILPRIPVISFYDLSGPNDFFSLRPGHHDPLASRESCIRLISECHSQSGWRQIWKLLLTIEGALLLGRMISMQPFFVYLLPAPNYSISDVENSKATDRQKMELRLQPEFAFIFRNDMAMYIVRSYAVGMFRSNASLVLIVVEKFMALGKGAWSLSSQGPKNSITSSCSDTTALRPDSEDFITIC